MTVEIMPATEADLVALVDGNALLAAESEHKTLDRAVLTAGVRAALADSSKARYFVARDAGGVVGMCMVTYEWSDWRCGWVWWLQSVYVWPAHRRRGVFRRLHAAARAAAIHEGAVALRLYVLDANDRALATYQAVGMSPSGYLVYEDDLAD